MLVTPTHTLRNRRREISHERYARSIVAEKPSGYAVVRVLNRMNGPFRNKDLVAGIDHEALAGNCHFEPTFRHGYELVGLMDKVIPFLARRIDEWSAVIATCLPVTHHFVTNYWRRKFIACNETVHGGDLFSACSALLIAAYQRSWRSGRRKTPMLG